MNGFDAIDRPLSPEQFVPFTARMMAALRAIESRRSDRLFNDPFAAQLAGAEAFHQVEQRLTAQDQNYVAVRTRFFDDFLQQTPGSQIVILAAGLDTRAYRLPWTRETKIYELDLPAVQTYKAALLQDAQPTCAHHLLAVDLTQSWEHALLASGYSPRVPSIWLIEGLLMYLQADQVNRLLKSVAQLTTIGSYLGLDLVNEAGLNYAPYRGYFQFGCNEPESLLSAYGWQATVGQAGDPTAHFGRYPAPLPAQSVPDVPRAFLVTAYQAGFDADTGSFD